MRVDSRLPPQGKITRFKCLEPLMYGRRSTRTHPHEKHMGSYELFSWRDAMALASWLEEDYDVRAVRVAFEGMSLDEKLDFEEKNHDHIEELIRRSESQRPAYVRKVGKEANDTTKGVLIVFAIIGQVRVKDLLELRDQYRMALAPGSGNRITCSELYAFQHQVSRLGNYDWPAEVFEAYGGNAGWADDDDEPDWPS
jgi:hypothetical protein